MTIGTMTTVLNPAMGIINITNITNIMEIMETGMEMATLWRLGLGETATVVLQAEAAVAAAVVVPVVVVDVIDGLPLSARSRRLVEE